MSHIRPFIDEEWPHVAEAIEESDRVGPNFQMFGPYFRR